MVFYLFFLLLLRKEIVINVFTFARRLPILATHPIFACLLPSEKGRNRESTVQRSFCFVHCTVYGIQRSVRALEAVFTFHHSILFHGRIPSWQAVLALVVKKLQRKPAEPVVLLLFAFPACFPFLSRVLETSYENQPPRDGEGER